MDQATQQSTLVWMATINRVEQEKVAFEKATRLGQEKDQRQRELGILESILK